MRRRSGPTIHKTLRHTMTLKKPACRFLPEPMLPDEDLPPGSAERIFLVLKIQDLKNSWKAPSQPVIRYFHLHGGTSCCYLDFVLPGGRNVGQGEIGHKSLDISIMGSIS